MAPLGLFLHELGHFLAARLLGYDDVRLGVAGVSRGRRAFMALALAGGTAAGLFLWMGFGGPPLVALVNRV